jgi:hypothetical protein
MAVDLSSWSDDDVVRRWNEIGNDFNACWKEVEPLLKRLMKLEAEISVIKGEILKRGLTPHETTDG